ncbi:MAG: serine hydrolase [Alphaproteobacteria bacterium]|nr:serine hydrolase [Alphaproteobacteria bacterium]
MKINRFAVILAASVGLEQAPAVQAADPLQPIIEVHEAQANVGLAVVLIEDGVVAAKTYRGAAVVEHGVPVSKETRFQVMSVTKAFVGAALVKSIGAGLVDLDAPVATYLPDYPKPAADEITVRMLAAHTAGLPHLGHPDRKAVYVERYADAKAALAVFRDEPLIHAPGSAYAYSSSNYTLIAAILEEVHGESFATLLKRIVLDPLGLDATAPGDVMSPTPGLARNYSYVDIWTYQPADYLQEVPTWDFSYNVGGGNLVTTAGDLAAFGDAFLRPGLFTDAELAMVFAPLDPTRSRWTLGWFLNDSDRGERFLSISGATPGVQAGLMVFPESGISIAALSNSWGRNSAGGALVIDAVREAAAAQAAR